MPKDGFDPWGPPKRRAGLVAMRRVIAWLVVLVAGVVVTWGLTRLLDRGAEAVSSDLPVAISLETNLSEIYANTPEWQAYGFVTPEATGPAPTARCRDWQRWASSLGGVDADRSVMQLRLQGRAGVAVVIDRVSIDIVRRGRPLAGTESYCPANGGAVASPRLVDIDLDQKPPSVLYAMTGDDYPARHRLPLTLSGPETETLEIQARTRRCDCEWRLELHLLVNGERVIAPVENGGRPFRTTASIAAEHRVWRDGRWRLMSRPEWKTTLPMNWTGFDPLVK